MPRLTAFDRQVYSEIESIAVTLVTSRKAHAPELTMKHHFSKKQTSGDQIKTTLKISQCRKQAFPKKTRKW